VILLERFIAWPSRIKVQDWRFIWQWLQCAIWYFWPILVSDLIGFLPRNKKTCCTGYRCTAGYWYFRL